MSQNHHDHGGCPHCWQEEWKNLQGSEGFERGISLVRLSRFAWRADQFAHSMCLVEEALEIFAEDPLRVANQAECYAAMAVNARQLGRNEEAYAFLDKSLELFQQDDEFAGVAWENNRCWWKFEDKEYEAALGFYRLTLAQHRKNEDAASVVADLIMVGSCLYHLGRYEEAIANYREARQVSKDEGQSYYVAMCDHNIGEALLATGAAIQAQGYVEQALVVFRLHDNPRRIGESLHLLGSVYAAQELWEKAMENFQNALGHMRNAKVPRMEEIIETEKAIAQVHRANGRMDEADAIVARLERVAGIMSDGSETIAS
jgi:tetratricopeptide (TPR) repeat protein